MFLKDLEDSDLQALVDRELGVADEKRLRAAIAENPELKKRYHQLLVQKQLLIEWFMSDAEEPEKSRSSEQSPAPAFLN